MYIGGRDVKHTDTYQWADGSPLTFAAWHTGQPDGGADDCLFVRHGTQLWWYDVTLTDQWLYIGGRSHSYPAQFYWLDGRMVTFNAWAYLQPDAFDWQDNCMGIAPKEDNHLWHDFGFAEYWAFIGGRDVDNTGTFVWPDGEGVGFNNWAPGEPNRYLKDDNCVAIIEDRSRQWHDVNCWFILPFICTQKVP